MHFEEGQTVGIDLGTTFSTVARLDEDGRPVALPNQNEEVETASLIVLLSSGHVMVGANRARAATEAPDRVVERIKRQMGASDYQRVFDGRPITPEFLSALILKKLRQDCEKKIGRISNAVITVPYYFNDVRRRATQDAGRIAGLNVIGIINEPAAATLTYAWHRGELGAVDAGSGKPRKVLVYDLGGGTFDVTVVQYTLTHFRVLATDGDVELGGIDWDERLVDHVAEEFAARHGCDPRRSPATLHVLRNECDAAKIRLSDQPRTQITCRHDDRALTVTVTREQFESMTADLLQRTADTTELVLEQAGVAAEDLDGLVMVGGSTLMPQVPRMVEKLLGRKPYGEISPQTAVAQGAAIHAAILEVKHRGRKSQLAAKVRKLLGSVRQENVNSHGLGIVLTDPESGARQNYVMIRRNSRLPVEIQQVFKTNHDGQRQVSIEVLEGDAPDPSACLPLGDCQIVDLPRDLPAGSRIRVAYAFDEAGRITVRAEEETGGRQASIEIERPGRLSPREVDAYRELASQYKVE